MMKTLILCALFISLPVFGWSRTEDQLAFEEDSAWVYDECLHGNLTTLFNNPKAIVNLKYANLGAMPGPTEKIPCLFHTIWLTHPDNPREISPKDIVRLIETKALFQSENPDWAFMVWTNDLSLIPKSKALLEAHGISVLSIVDYKEGMALYPLIEEWIKQKLFGAASDALRYEVMYKFGGVYADCGFKFFRAISDKERYTYHFLSQVFDSSAAIFLYPSFIAGSPHHPILLRAIALVERNAKNPPDYITRLPADNAFARTVAVTGNVLHFAYFSEANINTVDVVYPYKFGADTAFTYLSDDLPWEPLDSITQQLLQVSNAICEVEMCGLHENQIGWDEPSGYGHLSWLN